ncbi:MAG TPA: phenylalanine--tRNA ligase subunit alpha, partial [bacterium]|nr:phenylalanine--tRNA ligase subunit alpha [bacterium]
TARLRQLGALPADERAAASAAVNAARQAVKAALAEREAILTTTKAAANTQRDALDMTLPDIGSERGRLHPVTQTMRRMVDIFTALGFTIAEGPEVELDYYNFEALNIPATHPARDMHDTFYLTDDTLLRTHTSPVQARVFEAQKPPVRVIAPGKVYRRDYDVSHIPMFHQVEGIWVDEQVTFAQLKGVLQLFLQRFFGPDTRTRFRPSYFPFTEPSAEVDISCVLCGGAGCRVCKQSGWLEVLGCGMINPAVFAFARYDSERYTGFAFGMGVERLAMLAYGIDDIRLLYENDVRFLRQF